MSPKRGDRVTVPPSDPEGDVRFGTTDAVRGWEELCRLALPHTRRCLEALRSAPCSRARHDRQHRLRGQARMERQAVLDRDRPPVLSVVIEEHVLRRPVGGPEVMKEQLQRLMHCARRRNVTFQVMPSKRATHCGLAGPVVLLETVGHRHFAYLEGQRGSLLFSAVDDVSVLTQRFGIIRSRALAPDESLSLMGQVAGEL